MNWAGPLNLLHRAIRLDAQSWRWHAIRFGSAAILLILLMQAHWATAGRGTSGRIFFLHVSQLNFWLMTLIGLGFFPTAITEEKEEGTLPLLLLSGMPPANLLLAKAGGRLWSILLIFLAQLPFSLLALMLGGLTAMQILATWFALAMYLVALSGVGLIWSVLCHYGHTAMRWMLLSLVILNWGGIITKSIANWLVSQKFLPARGRIAVLANSVSEWATELSTAESLRSHLAFDGSERFVTYQSLFHGMLGLTLFVISLLIFRRVTEYAHEPITRPPGLRKARADRPRRRPWGEPVAWKEFRFLMSGGGLFALQILVLGLGLATAYYYRAKITKLLLVDFHEIAFVGLWSLFLCEVLYFASRVFAWEQRAGTLPTLMMLPRSLISLITAKLCGGFLACLPPVIAIGIVGVVTGQTPWAGNTGVWDRVAVFMSLVALIHLTTLYSLDYPWAAVPMAIGTFLVLGAILFPAAGAASYVFLSGRPDEFVSVVIVYVCVLSVIAMQLAIVARIRQIASM